MNHRFRLQLTRPQQNHSQRYPTPFLWASKIPTPINLQPSGDKTFPVGLASPATNGEKFPKVVDGGGGGHPKGKFVYAAFALGLSSTPSTNFTPAITLASNSYPFKRRQCFSATRAN